jgi:hypothetical protein
MFTNVGELGGIFGFLDGEFDFWVVILVVKEENTEGACVK